MQSRSGNGGVCLVNGKPIVVAKWTRKWTSRLTENTNSQSGGSTNYEHVVWDNSWSIEGPWDELNTPSVGAGLVPGAKVQLQFGYGGGSAVVDVLNNTSVENVEIVDDEAADIVRYTADGKGGFWSAAA